MGKIVFGFVLALLSVPIVSMNNNCVYSSSYTALHCAAEGGNDRSIDFLIAGGSDKDAWHPEVGTPLCVAAECGWLRAVQALLSHGVRTDLRDGDGKTAYELALNDSIGQVIKEHEGVLALTLRFEASGASGGVFSNVIQRILEFAGWRCPKGSVKVGA